MTELTRRQREILEYIISKVRAEERFPSYREIERRFRLSSSATVSQHLEALSSVNYFSFPATTRITDSSPGSVRKMR